MDFIRRNAIARSTLNVCESLIFGTHLRKRIAENVLSQYYASRFRRTWYWWCYGEPHYSDNDDQFFRIYKARSGEAIYALSRAFYAAELIRQGDVVLDIGCGDGGFTNRFLAPRAKHVDAIDIEPAAIRSAQQGRPPNVEFRMANAVSDPFPSSSYDLIVLDGALGHVSADDGDKLLQKISAALTPEGVFCGSESLGSEGHDHLQNFGTEADLFELLLKHFPVVSIRTSNYSINAQGYIRTEAYWRCATTKTRLDEVGWKEVY